MINLNKDLERKGHHLLRIGLAMVYLWFGFSQLFDGLSWVSIVPNWAVTLLHLPPAMIVLLNGSFEVVAGTLLAMNLFTRPVALLLGLHTALIAFELGSTPSGIRDFGLAASTLALAMLARPIYLRDLFRQTIK